MFLSNIETVSFCDNRLVYTARYSHYLCRYFYGNSFYGVLVVIFIVTVSFITAIYCYCYCNFYKYPYRYYVVKCLNNLVPKYLDQYFITELFIISIQDNQIIYIFVNLNLKYLRNLL